MHTENSGKIAVSTIVENLFQGLDEEANGQGRGAIDKTILILAPAGSV